MPPSRSNRSRFSAWRPLASYFSVPKIPQPLPKTRSAPGMCAKSIPQVFESQHQDARSSSTTELDRIPDFHAPPEDASPQGQTAVAGDPRNACSRQSAPHRQSAVWVNGGMRKHSRGCTTQAPPLQAEPVVLRAHHMFRATRRPTVSARGAGMQYYRHDRSGRRRDRPL